MKKIYTQPIIEVVKLENEDIITTSAGTLGGILPGDRNVNFGDLKDF